MNFTQAEKELKNRINILENKQFKLEKEIDEGNKVPVGVTFELNDRRVQLKQLQVDKKMVADAIDEFKGEEFTDYEIWIKMKRAFKQKLGVGG